MSMTRYNPWELITRMNDLLNSSLTNDTSTISTSGWMPAVDICESKEQYMITADLPGVHKENIEVSMANGVLTIKGERKEEVKHEEKGYSRLERVYGNFHRQFTLPESADSERIQANYENGVLKLRIPKKEAAKPRRITIADGDAANSNLLEHSQANS